MKNKLRNTGIFNIIPVCATLKVAENKIVYPLKVESNYGNISLNVGTTVDVQIIEGQHYTGSYIVTPLAYNDQELLTKNRVLDDNIIVQKVPKYETSNLSGGMTVYIAEV